jgi:hypothetical protein
VVCCDEKGVAAFQLLHHRQIVLPMADYIQSCTS